jgi:xylose isomerase
MSMTVVSHQAHTILLLAINRDLLGESGIIMNFNDHTVTWDTDTIPMKNRDNSILSPVEALIEIMFTQVLMNHKRSEMNILELPKF